MSGPRITPEAWADLQRRAQLKGLRLTLSESNGETRVWVNGHEVLDIDGLEAVIVHAASPWDAPAPRAPVKPAPALSPRQLEDEEQLRQARIARGAAQMQALFSGGGVCERCGIRPAFIQADKCLGCIGDAELCARLETTIAATPEGQAAALIERASRS